MSGYPSGARPPHQHGGSGGDGAPPSQPYGSGGYAAQPYGSGGYAAQPYGGGGGGGYGAPPSQPYGGGYGAPPPGSYGGHPPSAPYGGSPTPSAPYGGTPQPSAPYGPPAGGEKPPKAGKQQHGGGYGSASGYDMTSAPPYGAGSPFAALVPSAFPPGTDPNIVACFQAADHDGSGFIDDKELQMALSSYNQSFSLRTVHLLMYLFTSSNTRKIGPKEFSAVFYSLQSWRGIFERFDRDRSGKIDATELRDALLNLGFAVSPTILELLVSKFDKTGGKNKAIEYDNFIECCLTVKGLTEKFKEKDVGYTGSATFTYESFMLTVLPFLIA